MKRIFALLVAIILTACTTAIAETDLTAMTDDELMALMRQCSAELRERHKTEEGVLVFDQAGIRIYQTGEAYLSDGRIKVPVVCYNGSEVTASISPVFITCNGATVQGFGLTNVTAGASMTHELDFATADIQLTSLDDVYELNFQWQVYAPGKGVVLLTKDPEEHHFW